MTGAPETTDPSATHRGASPVEATLGGSSPAAATPAERPSYRALLDVRSFGRVMSASTLAATASQMQVVVIVLFALLHFHSAPLSGLVILVQLLPGTAVSPLVGALLDRGRRLQLITFGYTVAATAMALIGALALAGRLTPTILLLIVGVAATTNPLSGAGVRSLLPLMVPQRLWDTANGVDSSRFLAATILGPALGGATVAVLGGSTAILVVAVVYAAAVLPLLGAEVPSGPPVASGRRLAHDSAAGLVYVLRNRTLRGLVASCSVFNLARGTLTVALPLLVLDRLHQGAGVVGVLWAASGAAGMLAGLVVGRLGSDGRERLLMAAGAGAVALAMAVLTQAGTASLAVLAMILLGLGNGPYDIGMFALRQRRTAAAWFGRAFTVSSSLNYAGFPLGSALAGALVTRSLTAVLVLAALSAALATALPFIVVPATHRERHAAAG